MTDTTPDHIPAHVKNSYVNCSEYTRAPRLTPPPAAGEADNGAPAGVRFERDDPEIFFAGKQERLRAAEVVADHFIGLPA